MKNGTKKLLNNNFYKTFNSQKILVLMSVPFLLHLFVFRYLPIWGWIMAFQEYRPGIKGIFNQQWVGVKQFAYLFEDPAFYRVIRNTLAMSVIKLVLGTFFAISLAVLINETKNKGFRRAVQTISYLPHFVSWVVAANIVINVLSPSGGIVNDLLLKLNIIDSPILFMGEAKYFWWIIGWSHVWKGVGWGAIIYLSAMAGIDPVLYEAAEIDGAKRMQRIWHITIPGIKPTIIILLIMNVGYILDAGFEQQYLLKNDLVIEYAEVFEIYILDYGMKLGRYSYATAAGIFKSIVSILLITIANQTSKRLGEEALV